jgi:hypothetical protein
MTTVKYEVVRASPAHARELAANMAADDAAEVMAAMGHTPEEAVDFAMETCPEVWAGLADGRVLCLFGLTKATALGDVGFPWMLATSILPSHGRAFARWSKAVVRTWFEDQGCLTNYVHNAHQRACRWLQWLGFTLYPAEPLGTGMFHRFEMKRCADQSQQ